MSQENPSVSKKVLIIEDEREILYSLVATFEVEDYEVFKAESGRAGLSEFAKRKPDLVITDLQMPHYDGLEVTSRIRKVSDVPIMILSGVSDPQTKVECLKAGADDYVVKGGAMDELLARAARHLERGSQPILAVSESPPATTNSLGKSANATADLDTIRIVLTGAFDSYQKILNRNLERIGHSVTTVETHDEALKQFSLFTPQLVMISINMPGSKPLRLANYIKQKQIAPVILVADRVNPVLKAKSRILEVADIISPLIPEAELALRVKWAQLSSDRMAEKRRAAQVLKNLRDEIGKAG